MHVFVSWSGYRSGAVAALLKEWLPSCIQSLAPWVSIEIDKGARWFNKIEQALREAQGQGIICVTPENLSAPWLNFEAGVIAAGGGGDMSRVRLLLVDLKPSDLQPPLSMFNATEATHDDMLRLVESLNRGCSNPLHDDQLQKAFKRTWNEFDEPFRVIAAAEVKPEQPPHRTDGEALVEVLGIVRRLERTVVEQGADLKALAAERTWSPGSLQIPSGLAGPALDLLGTYKPPSWTPSGSPGGLGIASPPFGVYQPPNQLSALGKSTQVSLGLTSVPAFVVKEDDKQK